MRLYIVHCTVDAQVYMGALDCVRQKLNVLRMEALGAKVVPVEAGQKTLNDAVNEVWLPHNAHSGGVLMSRIGPFSAPTGLVRGAQLVYQKCRKRDPHRIMLCWHCMPVLSICESSVHLVRDHTSMMLLE